MDDVEKKKQASDFLKISERMLAGTDLSTLSREEAIIQEEEDPVDTVKGAQKKNLKQDVSKFINATNTIMGISESVKREPSENDGKLEITTSIQEDMAILGGKKIDRPVERELPKSSAIDENFKSIDNMLTQILDKI